MSNSKSTVRMVTVCGIFSAVVVILQLMSYFIRIGTFSLSLVLIPIIVAAVLYGPKYASVLGAVFGVVVAIASASGLDVGGQMVFNSNPALTVLVCILKGTAAGFLSGLSASVLKKRNIYLAVIAAAVIAPIANTGIFCISMALFFNDILTAWAGGTPVLSYMITGLIGVNFVIELLVNVVFSPAVLRVVRALNKARI